MAYYSKSEKGTPFQTKVITSAYAVNPNMDNPFHLFTSYSPTLNKALKKSKSMLKDIKSGKYLKWEGNQRRDNITRAVENGWDIKVENYVKW